MLTSQHTCPANTCRCTHRYARPHTHVLACGGVVGAGHSRPVSPAEAARLASWASGHRRAGREAQSGRRRAGSGQVPVAERAVRARGQAVFWDWACSLALNLTNWKALFKLHPIQPFEIKICLLMGNVFAILQAEPAPWARPGLQGHSHPAGAGGPPGAAEAGGWRPLARRSGHAQASLDHAGT